MNAWFFNRLSFWNVMMQKTLRLTQSVALFFLAASPVALGDFVIDDYSTGAFFATDTQVGDSTVPVINALRDVTRSSSSITAVVIADPIATDDDMDTVDDTAVTFPTDNDEIVLTYDTFNIHPKFGSVINFSLNNPLELIFSKTLNSPSGGKYDVLLELVDNVNGNFAHLTSNVPANQDKIWDPNATGPGGSEYFADKTSVSAIIITITKTSNNANTVFTFEKLLVNGIVAIPEPATVWLFGLTGVAGVLIHRRRRRKSAESDDVAA